MNNNIQDILNKAGAYGETKLPMGEFEGPFYITKPCTIIGNFTTLWAKSGPILVIESKGVVLKNLHIEITEEPISDRDYICISTNCDDTKFDNVEIIGNIEGIKEENGYWNIPKIINLENFKADFINSFEIDAVVPVKTKVNCDIKGISINPKELIPGLNKIVIETEKLRDKTFLYGEITFESMLIRRTYLNGKASENNSFKAEHKNIYKAKENNFISSKISDFKNETDSISFNPEIILLKKGQRIAIKDVLENNIKISFYYKKLLQKMEIDPYIFLLDEKGEAKEDDRLVFFGNTESKCKGIKVIDSDDNLNKDIFIDFDKIENRVNKISIAYSIYGDNPTLNFSKIISPIIRIYSNEKEKIRFSPEDLFIETTIVAVELYRYKNEWKINTVGAGYREGLKRLCESYGLTVV